VEFYNKGTIPNPRLSMEIKPLGLTEQEKADLVEFLHSLTGEIALEVLAPELPQE
jgi:cytochrome c peroxidase